MCCLLPFFLLVDSFKLVLAGRSVLSSSLSSVDILAPGFKPKQIDCGRIFRERGKLGAKVVLVLFGGLPPIGCVY